MSQTIEYLTDKTVQNSVEWKRPPSADYPYITVCNPRFFERSLMESKDTWISL